MAENIYTVTPNRLGYPDDESAASGYYLGPQIITKEELSAIESAMQSHGILPENTRVAKNLASAKDSTSTNYTLLLASAQLSPGSTIASLPLDLPGSPMLNIQHGDHSSVLKAIVMELESAKGHAKDPRQKDMIDQFIEAFSTGDHSKFKEAQKAWVRNINPNVEVVLGFIETYQDPQGIRGAWEGIVAVVNKSQSQRFSALAENSSQFITTLPWNGSNVGLPSNQKSAFESSSFNKPDFTSLDSKQLLVTPLVTS